MPRWEVASPTSAIVAREYGIPAVMDVHGATQLLRDNQRVILDGSRGIVEVLD